ncbi:MAG: histidine kinase [Microbacterium sp.]|jgi:signal transduction histidine kinase|nr:histidine kinase [Microbacterium sp.]
MIRHNRDRIGDVALMGALLLLGFGSLPFLPVWGDQFRPVDVWAFVLVGVAAVSAGFRGAPLVSFGITVIATSAYLSLGYPYGPILLCVAAGAYTLARRVRLPLSAIAAAIALLLLLAHVFAKGTVVAGVMALLPGSAWVIVPFSAGLARRLVVEYTQRQRADAERQALDAERLRLASEVHDIVGHGLAAIRMQADIARHIANRRPEQADIALEAISRASAEALVELRTTLASISPADMAGGRDSLAPPPGLRRLDDLCARMRESGISVTLTITGTRRPIAPAVDLAAYRIVQESLTNVARHSAARRAAVRICFTPDALKIDVVSAATPDTEVREGFGIAGMRRRAQAVDGSVTVSTSGEEFRVQASLPT